MYMSKYNRKKVVVFLASLHEIMYMYMYYEVKCIYIVYLSHI